jgi:site-specific DNA recombinase
MNRAALYLRVSTEDQAQKFGLPSQERALKTLCERKGFTIIGEYRDEGISGAILERPALMRLREAVRAKAIDVLCTYDGARLSRQVAHSALLRAECRKHGVKIEYATRESQDTPAGRLFDNLDSSLSEFERENTRDRTMRGRFEAATKGRFMGGPVPFGFAVKDGKLIPGPGAEVVTRMYSWAVDKTPCHAIAQRLDTQGIKPPRGKRWFRSTVRRILVNPVYSGETTFTPTGHDAIPVKVPALVSEDTFLRAQKQLTANTSLYAGKPTTDVRLLKGLLRCPCGSRMNGESSHGKPFYRCGSGKSLGKHCGAPYFAAAALEDAVKAQIEALLRNPETLREAIEANAANDERGETQSEASQIKAELTKVKRQRQTVYSDRLDGTIDKSMFTRTDKPLAEKEERLTQELERLETLLGQQAADQSRVDGALKHVTLLAKGIDRLDRSGWQCVFRLVIDHITVEPDRVVIQGILPDTETNAQALARATRCVWDAATDEARLRRGR